MAPTCTAPLASWLPAWPMEAIGLPVPMAAAAGTTSFSSAGSAMADSSITPIPAIRVLTLAFAPDLPWVIIVMPAFSTRATAGL